MGGASSKVVVDEIMSSYGLTLTMDEISSEVNADTVASNYVDIRNIKNSTLNNKSIQTAEGNNIIQIQEYKSTNIAQQQGAQLDDALNLSQLASGLFSFTSNKEDIKKKIYNLTSVENWSKINEKVAYSLQASNYMSISDVTDSDLLLNNTQSASNIGQLYYQAAQDQEIHNVAKALSDLGVTSETKSKGFNIMGLIFLVVGIFVLYKLLVPKPTSTIIKTIDKGA